MKEIILINSYTNTVDKEDGLRSLVSFLKDNKYEVCVSTHTPTPKDIIDRSDYFIYDKSNPILDDPSLQWRTWFQCSGYDVNFVSKTAKSHFLAYYRLIFGGLRYLKTFKYDIVHSMEFDISFKNIDELKENYLLIKNGGVDLIGYHKDGLRQGSGFSVNLNKVDLDNLVYDENDLKSKYKMFKDQDRHPLIENLMFDEFLPQNSKIKPISMLEETAIINTSGSGNPPKDDFDATPYIHEGRLYIFILNRNYLRLDINIIFIDKDNIGKTINTLVSPNMLDNQERSNADSFNIDDISNVKSFKLIVNNKLFFEFNLENSDDMEYIRRYIEFNVH